MSNPKDSLQSKFEPSHRFNNFGEAITRIHVKGFRCHSDTNIEIQSPITAFSGLNGTGKSTLLQLIACAYKSPRDRFHIKRFIISGKLDAKPFAADSSVRYEYAQPIKSGGKSPAPKVSTVARGDSRWTGYKNQPARQVYFAGVGEYLPRIEERDLATRYPQSLVVETTTPIDAAVRNKIALILGTSYGGADVNDVKVNKKKQQVVTVDRGGAKYSESNMGCGEGRIYYIVRILESLPDKSLVVLEEPETSLHPSAQHEFGKYLIDVCLRKGHQVFLTTHSENLLKSLPEKSRLFLMQTPSGLEACRGIGPAQAKSLMSNSHDPAFQIVVEDDVAKALVVGVLRRHAPILLRTIKINIGGSKDQIKTFMQVFNKFGKSMCVVLDGDDPADPAKSIFKLFGTQAPEKEIFSSQGFKDVMTNDYGVDWATLAPTLVAMNHHDWFDELARLTHVDREALIPIAAKAYLDSVPEAERISLVQQIQDTAAA